MIIEASRVLFTMFLICSNIQNQYLFNFSCAAGHQKRCFSVYVATKMVMNFYIDEKDEERERARLSRDGEGRTPPPTPSRDAEERAGGGWTQ